MAKTYTPPSAYTGPVRYQDGWHWALETDPDGGNPRLGAKLFLEDDGTYRAAIDGDASWHDRKHGQFMTIEMEDKSQPGMTVSKDDFDAIQAFLAERKGE
jgi:hypothetical protein